MRNGSKYILRNSAILKDKVDLVNGFTLQFPSFFSQVQTK